MCFSDFPFRNTLCVSVGNSTWHQQCKVAGVTEWPTPSNRKEVQSFLGFTNFYHRFIQEFSHLARPLFDLTQKDPEWKWGAEEQSAFDSLKEQIMTALILALLDNTQPFRVEADNLDFATGAVLSQQSQEDNNWHPVAFLSKSLSLVEQNYKIHNKEMLAIVRALEEWRNFVEVAEHCCEIWMDHKNLQYFMMAMLGDALLRPTFPPITLCHPCTSLLIVASSRRSALMAPMVESDC